MKKQLALSLSAALWAAPSLHAATVATWKELNPGATPITSNLNTDSPTLGDGTTANSAENAWMAGQFGTEYVLSAGQTITLTGSFTIAGGNSDASGVDSNGRQMRFGLFDDNGGFAADSATFGAGYLFVPDDRTYSQTTGNFVSTGGDTGLSDNSSTSDLFDGDSTAAYDFSFAITRNLDGTLDIVSSLTGGDNAYDSSSSVTNLVSSEYTYNTVGFLVGGATDAELVQISNVSVVIPEPSTAMLGLFGSLLLLRRRR